MKFIMTLESSQPTGKDSNLILSSLPSNALVNGGFQTGTVGQEPDKVYALGLCGGDSSPETCFICLDSAIQDITEKCPNQKEKISWGVPCTLRKQPSFEILELDHMNSGYNTNNITMNSTQHRIWQSLIDRIVIKASSGSSKL